MHSLATWSCARPGCHPLQCKKDGVPILTQWVAALSLLRNSELGVGWVGGREYLSHLRGLMLPSHPAPGRVYVTASLFLAFMSSGVPRHPGFLFFPSPT